MTGHAAQGVLVVTEAEEMTELTWKTVKRGVSASPDATDKHSHSQCSALQQGNRPRKQLSFSLH